ncbi:MAG: group III truncated hemoglobin [Phycisphaerales bacterium]
MPDNTTHLPLGVPASPGDPDDQPPVTTDEIRVMVERCYAHARADELLGPDCAQRDPEGDAHYDTMTRFWSSAVLRAGTYSGRPIEKHRIDGLTTQHFVNWVHRFSHVVEREFVPQRAQVFIELSRRMAVSIAMRIGVGGVERALAKPA